MSGRGKDFTSPANDIFPHFQDTEKGVLILQKISRKIP